MNYRFAYADKTQVEPVLLRLFDILFSNMGEKYPTGDTREEDCSMWSAFFTDSLKDEQRQLVLVYSADTLIGYFQYRIVDRSFFMEELQINKEHQGSGVFGKLYTWLLPQLPRDLQTVEAYTDKRNTKTQGVLAHLGLTVCGENKNGKSYHYKGAYNNLLVKYANS